MHRVIGSLRSAPGRAGGIGRFALVAGLLLLSVAWASTAAAQVTCHTVTTAIPASMQEVCSGQSSSRASTMSSGRSDSGGLSFGPDEDQTHATQDRDRSGGSEPARLIARARIGRIREILGAARLVVGVDPACPAPSVVDGLCFAGVARDQGAAAGREARVLGLRRSSPPDALLRGRYGEDFILYAVNVDGAGGLTALSLRDQPSDVSVPQDCFALPGEGVNYRLEMRGGRLAAQEVQTVVCGGGPRTGQGPYAPDFRAPSDAEPAVGAAPPVEPGAYPPTGAWMAVGPRRALAVPDPACDPAHLVHTTFCARSGVDMLKGDPGQKDLDLIVARAPAGIGDLLTRKDVEQWVLKRHDDGFKADRRWFPKYHLPTRPGCTAREEGRFRVIGQDGALFVTEVALNLCGAPPAPIPADIYEVDGAELPVAVHRDDCPQAAVLLDDLCFADAIGFMQGFGRTSTPVVLLRGEIYPGARLYPDHGLDMATITRRDDGGYDVAGGLSLPDDGFALDRCQPLQNDDPQRAGVRIVARGHRPAAIAYRWMSCPLY